MKLNELPEGMTATVSKIELCGAIRRRLQDLGLINGTAVSCVNRSPNGDPVAFCIRGALIALRNDDTAKISIKLQG